MMTATEANPTLATAGQPGDDCDCDCGGTKVLPNSPRARHYWISLPCQTCGKVRTYKRNTQRHYPRCPDCGLKGGTPRFVPGAEAEGRNEWEAVFLAALRESGRTIEELAESGELSVNTIRRYCRDGTLPERGNKLDGIKRLADVLDCPELVTGATFQVVMVCTRCEAPIPYKKGVLAAELERGFHRGADVDWEARRGTFICPDCTRHEPLSVKMASGRIPRLANLAKREGKEAVKQYFMDRLPKLTEEDRQRGLAKAREARLGVPMSVSTKLKQAATKMDPYPTGTWGICRCCGTVCFRAGKGEGADARRVETHRRCLDSWLQQNHLSVDVAYPPRKRGRKPAHQQLAQYYAMCVRHLLRNESAAHLARAYRTDARDLRKRVKYFIDLLPPEGIGGKRLDRWSRVLQQAYAERGNG